jgi:hypothetical protein
VHFDSPEVVDHTVMKILPFRQVFLATGTSAGH